MSNRPYIYIHVGSQDSSYKTFTAYRPRICLCLLCLSGPDLRAGSGPVGSWVKTFYVVQILIECVFVNVAVYLKYHLQSTKVIMI